MDPTKLSPDLQRKGTSKHKEMQVMWNAPKHVIQASVV